MGSYRLCAAVAAVLLGGVLPAASNGAIIYRETYAGAVTSGQSASSAYDWALHVGATATDKSIDTTTAQSINNTINTCKPADAVNVNAGAANTVNKNGIAFATPAVGNALFWTKEYPLTSGTSAGINPSVNGPPTFSWFQGNANTDGSWRVAVQVGGVWYVTDTAFFNTASVNGANAANFGAGDDNGNGGTNHGAELKTFTYTTAASAWDVLNFDGTYDLTTHTGTSGTALTRGALASADLSGTIDAFGLFSDTPGATGNRRFDTFTVSDTTPVPEPVAVATATFLALLLNRCRRGSC
jgi:hypothetical protein